MRLVVRLDIDDADRYVVAKYYADDRARATRTMLRRFIAGALRSMVDEREPYLRPRQRTVTKRLRNGKPRRGVPLTPPPEKQIPLF